MWGRTGRERIMYFVQSGACWGQDQNQDALQKGQVEQTAPWRRYSVEWRRLLLRA